MKNVYWLEKDKVAGREGPDLKPWNIEDLQQTGFTAILSVNFGESCDSREIIDAGMVYACIPLSHNAPPEPGDKELCINRLPIGYEFLKSNTKSGRVLIHCTGGKDRTGLMMAYYLIHSKNLTATRAMEYVKKIRPIAFTAPKYEIFCESLLQECTANSISQTGI